MAKPEREFSADVGQKSMGVAGPDYIEKDFDKVFAMFDPNKNLPDGTMGGIGKENMQPGAVDDDVIGNREVDDTQAPTGNLGKYSNFLNWFAYMIKSITGKANWRTKPSYTIEQLGNSTICGVKNIGGDIDLVAGTGMMITPDTEGKKITFAAKNDTIIPAPHAVTHSSIGSDPITPESIGAETPAGVQAKVDAHEAIPAPHSGHATKAEVDATKAEVEALLAAKKHSLIYLGESIDYGDAIWAIAVDDDFVYVGGATTQKVFKLNKSNLSKEAESIDYGGNIWAIAVDDNYVYVGGWTTKKVYKLNKSNLSKEAESIDYGGAIRVIAVDDDFVYAGGELTNKIYKLNKSNLSKVAESIDYGGNIVAIAVDDDFVYVVGDTTKKVFKLNKSDLSKVAESDYGGTIVAIAVDDDFVYAITNKIYKLNKSDLSKVAESIDYGDIMPVIAVDDDFVYAGGFMTNKIYKLNKSNLSKVAESDYGGPVWAIAVDDDHVYVGGDVTNKVYKLLNLVSLKN